MRITAALLLAPFFLATASIPALADCSTGLSDVEKAVRTSSLDETERLASALENSVACKTWERVKAKGLHSAKLVAEAKKLDPSGRNAKAAALVDKAAKLDADWHALEFQGRILRDAGKNVEAAEAFQEAINLIQYSDEEAHSNLPPDAWKNLATKAERENLGREADEAKSFAASGPNGTLVASTDRDDKPGGVYSSALDDRGAVGTRVPAPIKFEYNSASLKPIGMEAAQEMVGLLKDRNPKSVVVTGHTDHVGGADFNLKLSRERAATVAAYLRKNGITAEITIVGKGFSEPWKTSEGSSYTQAQIDELNRRVEFDWK